MTRTGVPDLRAIPHEVRATLLIFRPVSGRRIRDWAAASGWRRFHHVRSGQLVESCGVKAFAAEAPLGLLAMGPVIGSAQPAKVIKAVPPTIRQVSIARSSRSLLTLRKGGLS